jgi:hypothetical protein
MDERCRLSCDAGIEYASFEAVGVYMKQLVQHSLLLLGSGVAVTAVAKVWSQKNGRLDLDGKSSWSQEDRAGWDWPFARKFVRQGALLALTARKQHELDAATRDLTASGAHAIGILCDVRDREQIEQMITATIAY